MARNQSELVIHVALVSPLETLRIVNSSNTSQTLGWPIQRFKKDVEGVQKTLNNVTLFYIVISIKRLLQIVENDLANPRCTLRINTNTCLLIG